MSVQVPNGTVDIAVEDEAEAVAVAKKYLSYFQGALPEWRAADQRLLRRAIPENRLRVYDVRDVIDTLCDEGSVLEIRRAFGARHGDGAGPHRGQAVRHRRQQSRCISPAPSTPTARTRPRASCSCATPSTCRCCSCATRPA